MNRFAKLFTAALILTGTAISADARQVWYGPGSGANPFVKQPAPVSRPAAAPARTTLPPANCVAGSRCFNGYLDGHIPTPTATQARSSSLPPANCVAGSRCFNGYLDGHIPTR